MRTTDWPGHHLVQGGGHWDLAQTIAQAGASKADALHFINEWTDEWPELAQRCIERVGILPDIGMKSFGDHVTLTTRKMLEALGTTWYSTDHMLAGLEGLQAELGPRMLCCNTYHLDGLVSYRFNREVGADSPYQPPRARRHDDGVLNNLYDHIAIPVHVNGNHWTLFTPTTPHVVDFAMVAAGTSPGPSLEDTTSHAFLSLCDLQVDSHSCGVAVLQRIASLYGGHAVWQQEAWARFRMFWFLRMTDLQLEELVNAPEISEAEKMNSAAAVSDSESEIDASDATEPDAAWMARLRARCSSPQLSHVASLVVDADTSGDYEEPVSQSVEQTEPDDVQRTPKADSRKRVAVDQQHRKKSRPPVQSFTVPIDALVQTFRDKVLALDPAAQFFDDKPNRAVRCGRCLWVIHMHKDRDVEYLRIHRSRQICKSRQAPGPSIRSFLVSPSQQKSKQTNLPLLVPCPGLHHSRYQDIQQYLQRTPLPGGGASQRPVIALQLYGKTYGALGPKRQERVRVAEMHAYRWRNMHALGCVFATNCLVRVPTDSPNMDPLPCTHCRLLLADKVFKNALKRKAPPAEKMRFVRNDYREPELGDLFLKHRGLQALVSSNMENEVGLLAEYATKVADGTFDDQEVLLGGIAAVLQRKRREEQGKGMQNFRYAPAINNLATMIRTVSLPAYRLWCKVFPSRSTRSMRTVAANAPKFQPGISEQNVEAAAALVRSYGWKGPVALLWDDTKISPTLRELASARGEYIIVGQVGDPVHAKNEAELDRLLHDAKITLADKVRLYALVVPIHSAPPIILVATTRGGSENAVDLFVELRKLEQLMHKHGLHPISYSADGTETERKLQRKVAEHHTRTGGVKKYTIASDLEGCVVELSIILVDGRYPLVTVQDSKHGHKTGRNQPFSGARILSLGTSAFFYRCIRDLARDENTRLFRRDVEKVDRQDDRAAARLFSAENLEHLVATAPQQIGLALYLFFLGGLFDAWQNRRMAHDIRIALALRCLFFLRAWHAHILTHPEYTTARHFISRESHDILVTLCTSLIALIIAYREYYPDTPFLPWLHSTEPGEHIFGTIRSIKASFNFWDFLHFVPKLRLFLMGRFVGVSGDGQGNHTATGYWHTWNDNHALDLDVLSTWPTDAQIMQLSRDAVSDMRVILTAVGLRADRLLATTNPIKSVPSKQRASKPLPPPRHQPKRAASSFARSGLIGEWLNDDCELSLSELMAEHAALNNPNKTLERSIEATAAALGAQDLYESNLIQELPEASEDAPPDAAQICGTFAAPGAKIMTHIVEPIFAPDQEFSLARLVQVRHTQQNHFTSAAVRKGVQASASLASIDSGNPKESLDVSARIRRRLRDLLQQVHAGSAGYDRIQRWTGGNTIDEVKRTSPMLAMQKAFEKHRPIAFGTKLGKVLPRVHTAGITTISPLQVASPSYCVVWVPGTNARVAIADVLAVYQYYARHHASLEIIRSLGEASYLSVQVYMPLSDSHFVSGTQQQVATFHHLKPSHILFTIDSAQVTRTATDGGRFELFLNQQAASSFAKAGDHEVQLCHAIKQLERLLKSDGDSDTSEDDD